MLLHSMLILSALGILATILMFSIYDSLTFRSEKAARIKMLADVVAINASPALRFGDRADAMEILSSLRTNRSVRSAYLFDSSGGVLAEYLRPNEKFGAPLSLKPQEHVAYENDDLIVSLPVVAEKKPLGILYVRSDTEELKRRDRDRLLIAIFAGAILLCISFFLALRFQRWFTDPISELSAAMEHVTTDKDYTVRVERKSSDEFGTLMRGFNHMLNEISGRDRQLERQMKLLENTNKELDQFIYVASHDLKAPLRAVDNLAMLIRKATIEHLPPEKHEYLDLMHNRIRRMEALFDDLLQYSRAGRIETPKENVDTGALVRKIVELISPPPGFHVHIAEQLPKFRTARIPLEQVIRNLVSNALKHHDRPEGRIDIMVKDSEEYYVFSVCDDGPGIPPEYHEKIFQMFQTLRPRDEVEGSGMGLAFVKKIVENQRGRVWLTSKVGEGTCFYFTWPKQ
jgi:signal transduction histidine kinase